MSKKELVNKIKEQLSTLNTKKDSCVNLKNVPDCSWVGYTQVLKRKHIGNTLYKLYRVRLYSKDVSLEELELIHNELSNMSELKRV